MTPVIPRQGNEGQPPSEHADLYRERNRIERAFNRPKDYRRFATRFDKPRTTLEATVDLIATRILFLVLVYSLETPELLEQAMEN